MKFLLDQDVYATTVNFLTSLGHDVVRVGQEGLEIRKSVRDGILPEEGISSGRARRIV